MNKSRESKRQATNVHSSWSILILAFGLAVFNPVWGEGALYQSTNASGPIQVTGLWYDPDSAGQGFNLQQSPSGLFGYYYGYDDGKPLWLIFDTLAEEIEFGKELVLDALMPNEGIFGLPVPPGQGGVAHWGTLSLRFDSCTQAQAELTGLSGVQTFELTVLAGVDGLDPFDCQSNPIATDFSDVTGAWFDPATAGQGWNFVKTPAGLVGYFYGYGHGGDPLWLVTAPILEPTPRWPMLFDLLAGDEGEFHQPVPPAGLAQWGLVELTLADCRRGVARIAGMDGDQVQQIEMLAGVPGLTDCLDKPFPHRLNDTGINFCGDAANGNHAPCTSQQPAGQDAQHGRDAVEALEKYGSGQSGFDFSKISSSGQLLPEDATVGTGPDDWACTRDNHTGLIWELKLNDSSHHRHRLHGYTWFNSTSPDGNSGAEGNTASCNASLGESNCNTQNYIATVNAEGLCGSSHWRLPTRTELEGILHYGRISPAIDLDFFPMTTSANYWTAIPRVDQAEDAWAVLFNIGGVDYFARSNAYRVRLVHEAY
jgi:hypothetical protein